MQDIKGTLAKLALEGVDAFFMETLPADFMLSIKEGTFEQMYRDNPVPKDAEALAGALVCLLQHADHMFLSLACMLYFPHTC